MKTTLAESPPIACTLAAGHFKDRMAWIADLNRDALRSHRRDDLRLELSYALEAASRVRELAHREQECCAFLIFEVHEDAEKVRLTIDAPEDARDAADILFEQFQPGSRPVPACGCGRGEAAMNETLPKSSSRLVNEAFPVSGRAVGMTAAAAATGALARAACCVIPFAVPAVALTTAAGVLAWLAGIHVWVTVTALAAVAAGWIWVLRQSARTKCKPAKSTLYTMGIATVALALALQWPALEPHVLWMIGS
jgi:hypothetical protein